jgi:hypothetical protein
MRFGSKGGYWAGGTPAQAAAIVLAVLGLLVVALALPCSAAADDRTVTPVILDTIRV